MPSQLALPFAFFIFELVGKGAILLLSVLALRLVRRAPPLRMHSAWLAWGVASSSISFVARAIMTLAYFARIHLSQSFQWDLMRVDWAAPALLAYSSFCLLQLMLGLAKRDSISNPTATDFAE